MTRTRLNCILLLAAVLSLNGSNAFASEFRVGPGQMNIPENVAMESVSAQMLRPSYWNTFPEADKPLMGAEKINALNLDCIANADCNMYDLAGLDTVFSGLRLRAALADFSNPENLFLNGQPVPDSYYENIRRNIQNGYAAETMEISYGFCLRNTVMKSLPYSDWLSDDKTDPEWDELSLSTVMSQEPVAAFLTTGDGAFTYVYTAICSGWVPTEDLVLCHSKEEWLEAKDPEEFLVVTGDSIRTEFSYIGEHSEQTFEMGVRLGLCDEPAGTVDNRMSWCNYVACIAGKGPDGLYEKQKILIPAGCDVSVGYPELTQKNIIDYAFRSLGTRYGWGGSLKAQDCSSYVREIYLCFGLVLPRNTTWQAAMNVRKIDLSGMTAEQKKAQLDKLPAGTILQFPGHEMLYLGEDNGKHYVINDVSSLGVEENGSLRKVRTRSVILNSLEDTKRINGMPWLAELNRAIIVFDYGNEEMR